MPHLIPGSDVKNNAQQITEAGNALQNFLTTFLKSRSVSLVI